MSVLELARPELLAMQPYSSARLEAGSARVMLNANESPVSFAGASELMLNRYPDPQPARLIQALASFYRVRPEQVFVGRGSDEAIDLLTRAFCRAGVDAVLIQPPTFGMYKIAAQVQGAAIIEVPLTAERDFRIDLAALKCALTAKPKLLYLCSPNNPTGGLIERAELLALLELCRGQTLVVMDEAYAEFSTEASASALLDEHPHLVVLRTMSKAFGLAGERVGAMLAAPEIIGLMRRIMAPYPLPSSCVQHAMTALANLESVQAQLQATKAERARLYLAMRQMPEVLKVWPSQANFLAFRVRDARATHRQLLSRGVLVRDISKNLNVHSCLRVSIGNAAENACFEGAMQGLEVAA
jgi:histidinol-phosphate aminotransferase